ncbi:hypothetical protein M758_UG057800 [Ceratodon purpureus]|nr:hypothetical protein M758_UG057800 [Ceratodon purpureus]
MTRKRVRVNSGDDEEIRIIKDDSPPLENKYEHLRRENIARIQLQLQPDYEAHPELISSITLK